MVAIKGHFDGKVIVPDGPVDLPKDRPLLLHVEVAELDHAEQLVKLKAKHP